MSAPPLQFQWDGEAMVPKVPRLADAHFVVGEVYTLEERQTRSLQTHNHYFASLTEAWTNLPEEAAERFPTVDHLRKFALIRSGFRDERTFVCASKAEAQRLAAFIKPIDEFALIVSHEATVTVYTAKSQSMRAMGKSDFQKSKEAVLDYVASLIGSTRADVEKASAA